MTLPRIRILAALPALLLALAQAPPPSPRIGPDLRAVLDHGLPAGISRQAAAQTPQIPVSVLASLPADAPGRIDVFLETDGPLPPVEDALVTPFPEGRYAVRATPRAVRALLAGGAVRTARLSHPVRPALDRSGPYLGLGRIRRQDPESGAYAGTTGKGVIVGLVDSGLDFDHPDFRNEDGTTRLASYWDQREPGGVPTNEIPFGREWLPPDLNSGKVEGTDRAGHGTHVLGIAAGNGRASRAPGHDATYVGIAPEATLIAVRSNLTEYGVAVGVKYVMDRAAALGLPVAVNLSLGNQFGPHVGETPFERVLESFVGPGRLIVAAAGNDGHRGVHAEMHLAPGETRTLPLRFPEYDKDTKVFVFTDFEGWFDSANRFRFTLHDPSGTEVGPVEVGTEERMQTTIRGVTRIWYTEDGRWGHFRLELEDNIESIRRAMGTWTLDVEALGPAPEAELDFWIVNWATDTFDLPEFLGDDIDPEETILVPATADSILAVGAMSTRACWSDETGRERCYPTPPALGEVAYFSSIGPTSDGRAKPEILAPGFGVISCRASTISNDIWSEEELEALSIPGGMYWLSQGTSMSAPHVTGSVALLLERFPRLTLAQAMGRLAETARDVVDRRTGRTEKVLRTGDAVAPLARIFLSELDVVDAGARVRWFVEKSSRPVAYRVYKGFSDDGPFHRLAEARITGTNPYEIVDRYLEPGREQVYRIVAADDLGLEEDLDTVRVEVPGLPRTVFRAPDPNPARDAVSLRFYFPPTPDGGRYRMDVVDVAGRRIRALATGSFAPAGAELSERWDLTDDRGRRVQAGVFFFRLVYKSGEGPVKKEVRRVVVLP